MGDCSLTSCCWWSCGFCGRLEGGSGFWGIRIFQCGGSYVLGAGFVGFPVRFFRLPGGGITLVAAPATYFSWVSSLDLPGPILGSEPWDVGGGGTVSDSSFDPLGLFEVAGTSFSWPSVQYLKLIPRFSQFKKGESWASTGCVYLAWFTHSSTVPAGTWVMQVFYIFTGRLSPSSLHTPLHPVVAVVVSVCVSVGPTVYVWVWSGVVSMASYVRWWSALQRGPLALET